MTRRRQHAPGAGIAVASACADCAGHIGSPEPSEHGIRMAIVHDHHVAELEALGWIVTRYPHEPPDVACPHYHQANWRGDHDDCCGDGAWDPARPPGTHPARP